MDHLWILETGKEEGRERERDKRGVVREEMGRQSGGEERRTCWETSSATYLTHLPEAGSLN